VTTLAYAASFLVYFFVPMVAIGCLAGGRPGRRLWCDVVVAVGCTGASATNALLALAMASAFWQAFDSLMAAIYGVSAYIAWRYIWRRRRKDRVKKLAGAKARLIRDKMVQKVREQKLKPRLRPVPQPV
jgi:uncharacterized membrane protein YccC